MSKSTVPARNILAYGLLNQPTGKEIVEDLQKSFGFHAPAFIPDSTGTYDPIRAAIRDGQRQVILHIEKCIKQATSENPTKPTQATIE